MSMSDYIIVSRHSGAIEWLRQNGIMGRVIAQASPDDIKDMNVIGNLPLNLAAEAASVTAIVFDALPAEARGRDLSPEEMDRYGARLERYKVTKEEWKDEHV